MLPPGEYEKPISYYTSADLDYHKHTSSIQRETNGMHNDKSVYIYNSGDNRDGSGEALQSTQLYYTCSLSMLLDVRNNSLNVVANRW